MAKRILILAGSPRKGGNSEMICDAFLNGAKEAGHEGEKVRLRDHPIGYCLACDYCRSHNGACVHKDGMAEILEKMIAADVIVMATPVYFYAMDGQMKTLIDRTYPRYQEIARKTFYFVITAADSDHETAERTMEAFRGFAMCLPGAREAGVLFGGGLWASGAAQGQPILQKAYEMGKCV